MHLLWVEDEALLAQEGASYLQHEGYTVTVAHTYREAEQALGDLPIGLVLLDWMLPDRPGIDLCRHIQMASNIPVIMITAKTDEFDKVIALEIGADDYIAKPFGMRELVARIRAVLRRTEKAMGLGAGHKPAAQSIIRGRLAIDIAAHTVTAAGQAIQLTPTEFALLQTLALHPGRVYSRLQLLDEALGDAYAGYERTIDSHIRNLRKKLDIEQDGHEYIATVHGIGYKFAVQPPEKPL